MELHHPVDEPLRARRAARNVHVNGHHPVNPLHDAVAALEASTGGGARAHGDDPLWLRHLLPQPNERAGHLGGEGPRHDQHVRLPRARAKREHPEAVDVVHARRGAHHLDRAARQPREQRPERVCADQVEQVVGLGRDHLEQAMEAALRVLLHVERAQQGVTGRLVGNDDRIAAAGGRRQHRLGCVRGSWSVYCHRRSPFFHAYSSPNIRIARKMPIRTIPWNSSARTVMAHR